MRRHYGKVPAIGEHTDDVLAAFPATGWPR